MGGGGGGAYWRMGGGGGGIGDLGSRLGVAGSAIWGDILRGRSLPAWVRSGISASAYAPYIRS